jgi:putative tricarboxylic transport membrane protein
VITEVITSTLYGSLLGVCVGIIPGIAPAHLMSIMFMALFYMSPVELACFYIAILTVSQYVDSIPAVYFGVPGETSAIPASYEGVHLRQQGLGEQAIRLTAIGRLIAGAVGIVLCWISLQFIQQNTWFFSVKTQVVLLSLALVGVFLSSASNKIKTVLGMSLGYLLGMIGYNFNLGGGFMTFGIVDLTDGIPLICAMLGLYVVPSLIEELKKSRQHSRMIMIESAEEKTVQLKPHLTNMAQSSVIGWLVGLLPGLSYVLSSTVAYNWQKKKQMKSNTYTPGNLPSIVSAETANTAGAISTLIPLMVFGIPITWSESIIYNLMVMNHADFSQGRFLDINLHFLALALAISSVIGLIVCWPLSRYVSKILNLLNLKMLWSTILCISIVVIGYAGWYHDQVILYASTFFVCLLIGVFIRGRVDALPVVFTFLMQSSIETSVFAVRQLYF